MVGGFDGRAGIPDDVEGAERIEPVLGEKMAAQGIDPAEKMASIALVAAAVSYERPDLREHSTHAKPAHP